MRTRATGGSANGGLSSSSAKSWNTRNHFDPVVDHQPDAFIRLAERRSCLPHVDMISSELFRI